MARIVAIACVVWNCWAGVVIYQMFNPPPDFFAKGLYTLELNGWPRMDLYGREHIVFGSQLVKRIGMRKAHEISCAY